MLTAPAAPAVPLEQVHPGEPRAEVTPRRGQNRCRRTGFDNSAGLQNQDAVGQGQHIEKLVGDQHCGPSVTGQLVTQQLPHRAGGGDVESGEGLVEQQHVGVRGQCTRQSDTLGLTAGQLSWHPVGEIGRLDLGQPMRGDRASVPAWPPAMAAAWRERHIGRDAQVWKQQRLLQQQADPSGVRRNEHPGRCVVEHPVAQPDLAAVRPHQAGDYVQRRGLARAVGTQYRQHFAFGDAELDVNATVGDHGAQLQIGHAERPAIATPVRRVRAPSPSTTTAATATSRTDSATAESASVSRCR